MLLVTLAAAVGAASGPLAGQSAPPPDDDWLTLRTPHFRVTYTPELAPVAQRAAEVAERAHAVLTRELTRPPATTIDLVVTDHVDYTNGYASARPSPRIVVFARPPTAPQLAYSREWIELVVVHELVHIFHFEESGRVGELVRAVLGRVPLLWPVFPVAGSPTWNTEGLATHYESVLTGAGRVRGSFFDMVVRTAALEASIPDLDEVSVPHPGWPGAYRSYAFGSHLMDFVEREYGADAHRALIEATGGSFLPTFLFFDHVARDALGRPFDAIYRAWRAQATESATAAVARLREAGVTPTEPVARAGPIASAPRVSPDGRRLALGVHDYRSDPATRILDLSTGQMSALARRNQFGPFLGPAAWLPDGSGVLVAQLEMRDRYRAWSDLWRVGLDGRERRLTRGLRLAQPDVAPDGRRVAAVQSHRGGTRLVVHDLATGRTRVVAEAAPGDAFEGPRWSPAGDRLAAARYAGGRVDVVVIDPLTGALTPVTDDDALDLSPAWSPDGRWLLWSSDRTGVPNIMAAAVGQGGEEVRQVTRVPTGAFEPEVAPDGETLYLTVYHHDGWGLERLPFEPASWAPAPESTLAYGDGLLPPRAEEVETSADPGAGRDGSHEDGLADTTGPAGPRGGADTTGAADTIVAGSAGSPSWYSPWPTLRPYYWLPELEVASEGEVAFAGLTTGGRDVLSRHAWGMSAGVDLGTGWFQGRGAWTYEGLGNPTVHASVSRDWDRVTSLEVTDGSESIYRRTDVVRMAATLWRPGWRSTGWLGVGLEVEDRGHHGRTLSRAELAEEGWTLRELPTTAGFFLNPGYSTARYHPFSISAEDGVSASLGLGRWWNTSDGIHAYDEFAARLAGYFAFAGWGHTNHVLAGRMAGVVRDGQAAIARGVGGVPGGSLALASDGVAAGSWFPVRGFESGARWGTRAWAASAEWRFPIHIVAAPGNILGFSLTAVSGTVFADLGDAWCTAAEREDSPHVCAAPSAVLASVGTELTFELGVMHQVPSVVRIGFGQPVQGGSRPALYLAVGPAF
ncbi:MAG: hypothetical protein ACLFRX_03765 [Gemmatimonadota bacterium]